jgi:hypothetical protein
MQMQTHEETPGTPASGADAAAAAAANAGTVAPEGGAATAGEKLIQPAAGTDPLAWAPEKHRVLAADGTLDEPATARKLADAYRALETKLGSGEVAPGKPEDYALAVEEGVDGIDFEAFKSDPLCQGFLKGAHAKGMTNAQVNYALNEYMKLAPQLMQADAALSATEAKAELGKLWADPSVLDKNIASVNRAVQGFGGEAADMPGSRQRLVEKFGNDPDFIAFAARVAGEMGEDKLPIAGMSSEADVEALQKSKAYWDPNDPQHAATKAKVAEFYAKKYGAARK